MSYQILFVCLGNICRSPAAEGIMKHLIQEAGLTHQFQCDSAGTSSYHIGAQPDRRMAAAAQQRGLTLQGRSRQFHPEDFSKFDLILAMDRENYRTLLSCDPSGQYHENIRLMCDFCRHYGDQEVPDPYYGGTEGFTYVIDLLLDACDGLLHHLTQVKPVI
jgi:protein-tyrosine phosphatase